MEIKCVKNYQGSSYFFAWTVYKINAIKIKSINKYTYTKTIVEVVITCSGYLVRFRKRPNLVNISFPMVKYSGATFYIVLIIENIKQLLQGAVSHCFSLSMITCVVKS